MVTLNKSKRTKKKKTRVLYGACPTPTLSRSLTLTASGKKSRSMRRPPLQFLAAASTDVSSITTMSSRSPVLSLSFSLYTHTGCTRFNFVKLIYLRCSTEVVAGEASPTVRTKDGDAKEGSLSPETLTSGQSATPT